MKKIQITFLVLIIGCFTTLFAQTGAPGAYSNPQGFMSEANGKPLYSRNDLATQGSPYFSSEYCTANLKVRNGKMYAGIKVKINLEENLVIYDAGDGKEMVASSPIDKVEFFNCSEETKNKILVSGFPSIDQQDQSSFYVLLDSGAVQLLKSISVSYRDVKFYSEPNMTRVYEKKENYYAYSPGKGMMRLTKDNNEVLATFTNKKEELTKFIAGNNIKCKKEEDLVKLFNYYNSLNR